MPLLDALGAGGGAIVSAAGNVAGGYAAQALIGDTSYPEGGGIEGLKNTDPGKSGIPPVVQIDSTKTLEYFKKAAEAYTKSSKQGLDLYNAAIQSAMGKVQAGTASADTILSKYSTRGDTALDQYIRMLGLSAPSPTRGVAAQLQALGPDGQYNDIVTLLKQAESVRDSGQRTAIKQNILNQLSQNIQEQTNSAQAQYNNQMADLAGQKPTIQQWYMNIFQNYPDMTRAMIKSSGTKEEYLRSKAMGTTPGFGPLNSKSASDINKDILYEEQFYKAHPTLQYTLDSTDTNPNKSLKTWQETLQEWDSKVQGVTNTYNSSLASIKSGLQSVYNSFNNDYDVNQAYMGYTDDEVAALESLGVPKRPGNAPEVPAEITAESLKNFPGYQFALQQGLEASTRSAAANGMLNSGNTLAALTQYAEGLATQTYGLAQQTRVQNYGLALDQYGAQSNTFNQYMNNLLNVAGIGVNAASQQASNQLNQGISLANLFAGQGTTQLGVYQDIGAHEYDSQMTSGSTYNTNQLENMRAQNAAILGAYGKNADIASAAVSNGANYGSLGLATQRYNDTKLQNQQSANVYNNQLNSRWLAPN